MAARKKISDSYKKFSDKMEKDPVPGIILLSLNEKFCFDDLLKLSAESSW